MKKMTAEEVIVIGTPYIKIGEDIAACALAKRMKANGLSFDQANSLSDDALKLLAERMEASVDTIVEHVTIICDRLDRSRVATMIPAEIVAEFAILGVTVADEVCGKKKGGE